MTLPSQAQADRSIDAESPDGEANAAAKSSSSSSMLNAINQVPVRISAVLGKARIDVESLMNLNEGAIVELDRKVGEPIDIYANDRLIARGELVLVDGALGVTLTEIAEDASA